MKDDVARYYTPGVRFPRLVGKTADGARIPGGPYTITQAVGGLAVFVVGNGLRPLWGGRSLVADYGALLVAVVVTVFALKFVRSGGRDPFTAGLALLGVYTQPRSGRVGGRAVRIRPPRRVRGRIALLIPASAAVAPAPRRSAAAPARPASAAVPQVSGRPAPGGLAGLALPAPAPGLSAVGRRLAAATPARHAVGPTRHVVGGESATHTRSS